MEQLSVAIGDPSFTPEAVHFPGSVVVSISAGAETVGNWVSDCEMEKLAEAVFGVGVAESVTTNE